MIRRLLERLGLRRRKTYADLIAEDEPIFWWRLMETSDDREEWR